MRSEQNGTRNPSPSANSMAGLPRPSGHVLVPSSRLRPRGGPWPAARSGPRSAGRAATEPSGDASAATCPASPGGAPAAPAATRGEPARPPSPATTTAAGQPDDAVPPPRDSASGSPGLWPRQFGQQD